MLGLLGKLGLWLLNLLFPAKDQREEERKAGERIGVAETTAHVVKEELSDAQKAVDASRRAGAFDDAGGLREPRLGEPRWDPNGVG